MLGTVDVVGSLHEHGTFMQRTHERERGTTMRLRMLARDGNSGDVGCPSVYLTETGELVVHGRRADPDTMGRLANLLDAETAVVIDADTVARAIAAYHTAQRRRG
jgi:hypothetical protein